MFDFWGRGGAFLNIIVRISDAVFIVENDIVQMNVVAQREYKRDGQRPIYTPPQQSASDPLLLPLRTTSRVGIMSMWLCVLVLALKWRFRVRTGLSEQR